MTTLIQLQDEAIRQMREPRSSEKRAAKHRAAVLRQYKAQAMKLGYTVDQAEWQVRDIRDMYILENAAEGL
jgi:hypothetical protein